MRLLRYIQTTTFLFLPILILIGCTEKPPPPTTLAEANEAFLKTCREEFKLNPLITPLKNTLYIYLPVEHNILHVKATTDGPDKSGIPPKARRTVNFLDGYFDSSNFVIDYDISPLMNYPDTLGYGSLYNEAYTKKQQNILQALYSAYADLDQEHLPGDVEYFDAKKDMTHKEVVRFRPKRVSPDFIVLIIADMKNGIEVITTFHFLDYKYASLGRIPMDEYVKRTVSETIGRTSAVGDYEGKHIEYKDVTWHEFLSKQITHRIRFKFQQSSFPPSDDYEKEILEIIYTATRVYSFSDFKGVKLHNLVIDKEFLFSRSQLQTFGK